MIDRKRILLLSTVKPLNVSNSWPCNQTLKTPHLLRLRKKMQNAWGHFSPKLHNDGGCVCWRFSWTLGLITVQRPQLPQWQKKNMLFRTITILGAVLVYRYTGEFLLFSYPYMELWRSSLMFRSFVYRYTRTQPDFARILNLFSFLKTQPRAFCLQHKHKSNSNGARKHHISRIHTKHALNRRIYLVKYFITGCKIKSESFQFPLPHKH